ncbi:MAG TPA: hypothetical protein VFI73_09995 [Candidatus Nitrosopolaris sp.]|nr:hypothetical protein [Candidatus Nitrosopolaris sp.]
MRTDQKDVNCPIHMVDEVRNKMSEYIIQWLAIVMTNNNTHEPSNPEFLILLESISKPLTRQNISKVVYL